MIAVIDYLFLYSRLPQTLNEHLMMENPVTRRKNWITSGTNQVDYYQNKD